MTLPKVTLYIATSLDDHIAGPDGGLEWLPQPQAGGEDYGYAAFYAGIDTLVMGRTTYAQVQGFGDWPYAGKETHVFTHRPLERVPEGVHATACEPQALLQRLAQAGRRHVWLVGGARTVQDWLNAGLVDEFIVSVAPMVLGSGISLFAGVPPIRLRLLDSHTFPDGLVQLHYARA
ncbi:dihydrofolate reductase family protein [Chitiniphilus purpureus]|uniref:Dihydrofolate reductase family protein n=1 Tax=Chitiniphilus purpureus TaxID=2981137 RepID=A0ABY6DJK0_9NEIS|nr:dihydrofolate reductase family protein [Chitiniphilus sp. CD1]UXY14539.1 dihydrofolate reductase family protein [Chitiniphilus sp. CD1]